MQALGQVAADNNLSEQAADLMDETVLGFIASLDNH